MNTKKKAEELVEKYEYSGELVSDIRMSEEDAKECALICVEQMIEECEGYPKGIKYWQDVKQEIYKQ